MSNKTQLNQLEDNTFHKKFSEALESDNVAQKLSNIIQHAILSKLNNKLDELFATIGQLRREIENKDAIIADLHNSSTQMPVKIQQLEARIADQDANIC